MQKELEQIIKDYSLEGTRIQVGRQRIYPQREGLNATPEQLENLKSVLEGNSVKGTLRITAGDVVVAANTAGAIDKPFIRNSVPAAQAELFEATAPVESKTEAPSAEGSPDAAMENIEQRSVVMQSSLDRNVVDEKDVLESQINPEIAMNSEDDPSVNLAPISVSTESEQADAVQTETEKKTVTARDTYLDLLKQSPAFEGVEVTYEDLQSLSPEAMKPLDTLVLKSASQNNLSRDEAESMIGAASPYIQASVDKIQVSAEALVTPEFISASEHTQAENTAARETYLDLLQQHPEFKGGNVTTYEELLTQAPSVQQLCDRYVSEMAFEQALPREDLDRVIAQGSPYVQQQLDTGSLTNAGEYLTQISKAYHDKLQEGLEAPTPQAAAVYRDYENVPHEVEQRANQITFDELTQSKQKAQGASQESAFVSPSLVPPIERNSDIDYPQDAQTLDPANNLKNAIAQGSATVKEKVLSSSETLALAQKNMTTFAKHVKHRGLKAWAKEQMPILQSKAKELAQAQASKIVEYAKEQAPIIKEAAISGAKQVGDRYVRFSQERTPTIYEAEVAFVDAAKATIELGRNTAQAIKDPSILSEKAKALGEAVVERIAEYTQLVDPVQIEKLGSHVLGNDGGFEGNTFDFKRGQKGVDISLKNGTPVFSNGKLNPKLDGSYVYKLNKLAEKVEAVKAAPQVEEKKKAIAR